MMPLAMVVVVVVVAPATMALGVRVGTAHFGPRGSVSNRMEARVPTANRRRTHVM